MELRRLEIRMNEWGEAEGKYTGTLVYKDKAKTEMSVELTPEQAAKFLIYAVPILCVAADNASERFKTQLVESTAAFKELTNG